MRYGGHDERTNALFALCADKQLGSLFYFSSSGWNMSFQACFFLGLTVRR